MAKHFAGAARDTIRWGWLFYWADRASDKLRDDAPSLCLITLYSLHRTPKREIRQRKHQLKSRIRQGLILQGLSHKRRNARVDGKQEMVQFRDEMPVSICLGEPERPAPIKSIQFFDKAMQAVLQPVDTQKYTWRLLGYRRRHFLPDMGATGGDQVAQSGKVPIDRGRADAGASCDIHERGRGDALLIVQLHRCRDDALAGFVLGLSASGHPIGAAVCAICHIDDITIP
ncbi:hypothetical protein GCM10010873_24000 [Cypionkella aquatica]|uniref:Uncharacterized protein n=1 Tax=Cypionkella aquatica TaxID=1756042 RepID=A0AA37X4E9_9RHOB|nr:hypothetical protein GCM10010873_24000 [Cypionkella aquatica]